MYYIYPAYGRMYFSKEEVLADWNSGKDFRLVNGTYLNKTEAGSQRGYQSGESQRGHELKEVWYQYHTPSGPLQFRIQP